MRAHAELAVPLGGAVWEGGAKTFIHKGTNGRWRDVLTEEDLANYESRALEELGLECAQWLASGEL
jgi:aryl sulfotransferase